MLGEEVGVTMTNSLFLAVMKPHRSSLTCCSLEGEEESFTLHKWLSVHELTFRDRIHLKALTLFLACTKKILGC